MIALPTTHARNSTIVITHRVQNSIEFLRKPHERPNSNSKFTILQKKRMPTGLKETNSYTLMLYQLKIVYAWHFCFFLSFSSLLFGWYCGRVCVYLSILFLVCVNRWTLLASFSHSRQSDRENVGIFFSLSRHLFIFTMSREKAKREKVIIVSLSTHTSLTYFIRLHASKHQHTRQHTQKKTTTENRENEIHRT